MDYTKITILGHEFHDDDWGMMLWHYYRMCCTTITTFIVEILRSMWTIEFAAIIRDASTTLHAIDIFVGSILIYGSILVLVWIAGVFVRSIVGLFGSIATTKDTTENTKDATKTPKIRSKTRIRLETRKRMNHCFILCRRVQLVPILHHHHSYQNQQALIPLSNSCVISDH